MSWLGLWDAVRVLLYDEDATLAARMLGDDPAGCTPAVHPARLVLRGDRHSQPDCTFAVADGARLASYLASDEDA